MAIMNGDPGRAWSGKELADKLQITPRNLLTQLAEWARLGFLTHTARACTPWPPARHRP